MVKKIWYFEFDPLFLTLISWELYARYWYTIIDYRNSSTIFSSTILCSVNIDLNHVVLGNSVNLRSTRAYSIRAAAAT